jgi:hypothetical protein
MTYTRSQLITALHHEYEFLCHDDFDPDVDPTPDEYLAMLNSLSDAELIDETSTDDIYHSRRLLAHLAVSYTKGLLPFL